MSREQPARCWWHAIERLREPSSAAGLDAPSRPCCCPGFAHALAIVRLALTALVAILRGEGNGSNGG